MHVPHDTTEPRSDGSRRAEATDGFWGRGCSATAGNREATRGGVIMTIPVAILFFVFQRRIMNTTAGAEKG